jgi:hypothetical protein
LYIFKSLCNKHVLIIYIRKLPVRFENETSVWLQSAKVPCITFGFIDISTNNGLTLQQQQTTLFYFVYNGFSRYSLVFNGSQLSIASSGVSMKPLAVGNFRLTNQLLLLKGANQVQVWNMTDIWVYKSAGKLYDIDSDEIFVLETQFNIDINMDGIIGPLLKSKSSISWQIIAIIIGASIAGLILLIIT